MLDYLDSWDNEGDVLHGHFEHTDVGRQILSHLYNPVGRKICLPMSVV